MPGTPMVGRDEETAILLDAVQNVARGEQWLLVVRGEAGIGKTRLLDALQELLTRRQHLVLRGRATELESDIPLAPVVEALGPHGGVPMTGPEGEQDSMSTATRWRLYRDINHRLDALAQDRPLALILDDMHWADPATLEFLEHTIRRPPARAHLLALALRPGAVASRLSDARRMTGGRGASIDLRPLDSAAADLLIPRDLPGDDRARIFHESGGNPMLIEELARTGAGGGVPGAVIDHVRVELQAASPAAQAFVQAGAVLGDPFDIDLARTVADLTGEETIGVVNDLVERALITSMPDPRRLAFRHPVVRNAVYVLQPAGTRLAGHRRVAELLGSIGAPLPDVARHLAHSAAPGDAPAAATLREAARIVRPQAPVIAADWLLAANNVDPAGDLDTLVLAQTLIEAGRLAAALAVAEAALAAPPTAASTVRLTLLAASVERLIGRHDAARRRLISALRERDPGGPDTARLLASLAMSAYEAGAFDQFGSFAERALDVPAADPLVRAVASVLLAVADRFAGRAAQASAASTFAVVTVQSATDDELAAQAELLTAVPWALLALERLPDVLATGRRTAGAARRAGNTSAAVAQELAVVLALGLLGRIRECADAADVAEQSARMTGNGQIIQWALWMRAWALLERGDVPAANLVAAESVSLADGLDDSSIGTVARAVQGAALVAIGEPATGAALLAAYDLDPGWVCRWAPILVEADLALGDLEAAGEHVDRAAAHAAAIGLAGPRAAAARAAALLALSGGDHATALRLASSAIREAESVGAAMEVARAQLLAGRALAGSNREAAIDSFELARLAAERLGAQRVHDEAVREMRRLGRRIGRGGPRAAGLGVLGALSPREREIAQLVAQGCTNKEIAGRLFLSEKTVESHLSRTFGKLGVRSRAGLAGRIGQGD